MTANNETPPLSTLLSLSGQRALVTGSSGNIGRGIALRLAEAGADVIVHYNSDASGAAETVELIAAAGGSAYAVQGDLASQAGVDAMFAEIDTAGPAVTAVVNNAGSFPVHALTEMTADDWRQMLASNLDSAFYAGQAAARRMQKAEAGGAVVNIASIEGSDPAFGHAHYATAKAGLIMLTRSCAMEYGTSGIRFNTVSPGLIERPGIAEGWPEGVASWESKAPLGRLGRPDDIADATLFLLSSASRWVTGVDIKVDGGLSTVSRW